MKLMKTFNNFKTCKILVVSSMLILCLLMIFFSAAKSMYSTSWNPDPETLNYNSNFKQGSYCSCDWGLRLFALTLVIMIINQFYMYLKQNELTLEATYIFFTHQKTSNVLRNMLQLWADQIRIKWWQTQENQKSRSLLWPLHGKHFLQCSLPAFSVRLPPVEEPPETGLNVTFSCSTVRPHQSLFLFLCFKPRK